MNILIRKLTKEKNEEFNSLLEALCDGAYWENEGWTAEHGQMRPRAEDELQQFIGENINLLSEAEWRTIHNALAIHQCGFRQHTDRQRIQQLMDKVRDNYIAPCAQLTQNTNDISN